MIARPTVREIFDRLQAEGALPAGSGTQARAALEAEEAGSVPWYVRLLVAFGAWVGALFLLSFVVTFLALVLEAVETASIAIGAVLMPGAVLLRRRWSTELARQLALVMAFAGQGLFVGGIGAQASSMMAAAIAALVTAAVLIALLPDAVYRVCATVLAAGAATTLLHELRVPYGGQLMVALLAVLPLWFWRGPMAARADLDELVEPIGYGAVVAMFGLLLAQTLMLQSGVTGGRDTVLAGWILVRWPLAIVLMAALLWLMHVIVAEQRVEPTRPAVLLATAGVLALGVLTRSTPAIPATLLMLVFGFDRRRPALIGLAAAFLMVFGAFYYYNLELTLLQKSGVLIGSGVLCLADAAFVRRGARENV